MRLKGTRWMERDRWSGRRVIEVTNDVDIRDAVYVEAIVVENSHRPEFVGRPIPRPIRTSTLKNRWVQLAADSGEAGR